MFTRTHLAVVMAGTAIVGLGYYAKATLGRRAPGCRIIGKSIDPLINGDWKPMIEFELEGTTCIMQAAFTPDNTLNTISQLPVDNADVFVAGYPKSGTLQLLTSL